MARSAQNVRFARNCFVFGVTMMIPTMMIAAASVKQKGISLW
jgi:hypothetical protein